MNGTFQRRTSARRLASGVLAAALLAAMPVTSAARAAPAPDDTTTTPPPPDTAPSASAPAPTEPTVTTIAPDADVTVPSEPTASGDTAVARPRMVQRNAVVVGATGFRLQYRFDGNLGRTTPTPSLEQSITPEASFVWADEDHFYLQWDYPMPSDGETTVTMTAPLYDLDKLTDYTVEYTSQVNRTGGSIAVRTTCEILRGGAAVDLDNDSPFTCEGASAQAATGAVQVVGSVRELNWASVVSYISTKNDGAGPKISLGDGTFSTANQEQRIIMNGREWYPTEKTGPEQRALPYATIANGQSLMWSAAARNGTPQSEPDSHAQASFAYRIYLDGAPTSFWINGFAEGYRYLSGEYSEGTCDVFLGNPDGFGEKSERPTPFTCSAVNYSNLSSGTRWDFEIRMADVDTLHQQRDAVRRNVVEACTPDDGPCIQAVGRPQVHVTDVDNARTLGSNANVQGAPEEKEWRFSTSWSREITDSVEQSFGMKTSTKFEIASQEFDVEVSSKTSYGYDLTKSVEYEFKDVASIPFGSIGTYTRLEAWNVYSGDLYFFGDGDRWYRVTGSTIEVPIEPTIFGGENPLEGGHIEAKQGVNLGEVKFGCVWDVGQKATVLLSNDTVEKLNGCTIPEGWDDTVPDIKSLEDVPRDLITQVRDTQRANAEALQDALDQQASRFRSTGG